MKTVLILISVFLVIGASSYAQEVKNCPYGYDAGGDCLSRDDLSYKPVPKMTDKENPSCLCGYDSFGNCISCRDSDYDETERQYGEEQE